MYQTGIYLVGIRDPAGNVLPYTKIGISSNLKTRVGSMATSSPFEFFAHSECVLDTRKDARTLEKEYHALFSKRHVRGEWFHGAPADIEGEIRKFEGDDGAEFIPVKTRSALQ